MPTRGSRVARSAVADRDLTLEAALARQRLASRERVGPEIARAMAEATGRLAASGIGEQVLKAGERAPELVLPNVRGEEIRLGDLLGRGAVVLAFYRGGW
jgi:hypothetical protein